MLTYLKAARGRNVMREIKEEQSGKVIDRVMPSVVTHERPSTNEADAAAAWRKAKAAFLTLKTSIEAEIASIESMRQDILALQVATADLQKLKRLRAGLDEAVLKARQIVASRIQDKEKTKSPVEQASLLLGSHLAGRPGFFSRLFATAAWKTWSATQQKLSATLQQVAERAQAAQDALELAEADYGSVQSRLQQLSGELSSKQQEVSTLEAAAARAKSAW